MAIMAMVVAGGVALESKDELHRRKLEALGDFIERLLRSPVRDSIGKMVLHGSVPKVPRNMGRDLGEASRVSNKAR